MNITCSHCGCVQPISPVEVKTDYKLLAEAKKLKKEIEDSPPFEHLKVEPFVAKKKSFWDKLFFSYDREKLNYEIKQIELRSEYRVKLHKLDYKLEDAEKYSKYWICKLCKSKNGIGTHI